MSISLIPSLQILPVEILHYILDGLDVQTILFSFRNTCRKFRAIVNNYDRYVLNFQSISKPDFDLICHLIDPYRVTSFTLSENDETCDQIKLFLSHFNLRRFSRLRSLSLCIHEEEQLKTIVERFNIRSLESFSLKINRSDDRRKTTTARLLSSLIAKLNLSKLELYIQDGRFEKILWPTQCSIKYLRIENIISFDQIRNILQCSPTVSFNDTFVNLSEINWQWKLLRWESMGTFIRLHLPLLNKFEIFFHEIKNIQQNLADIEHIIASFQTPFWLEQKKWFVVCELDTDTSKCINLYSIPICVSSLPYEIGKTSISTYPKIDDKDTSMMDNVDTVRLDFTKIMSWNMEKKENITNYPLFRKVKRLELQFDACRAHGWIEFVSSLIDLKTIIYVKVSSTLIRQSHPYMLADITKLFQRTSHVSSVDIGYGFLSRKSSLTAAEINSMVPPHVKHLAVSIKDLDEIKNIFQQLQHLSSANFCFDYIPYWMEITNWLDSNRKSSSYQADSFSLSVWLGRNTIQPKVIKTGNKRVKLTDEHYQ